MSKREAILQATIDVVANQGMADAPTILIAKKAGAAELTLFRLFGNKQGLLHGAFNEVLRRYRDECWPNISKQSDVEKKLTILFYESMKYYRNRPNELAFFQQYINSSEGIVQRPDFRYEKGEDASSYPLISILDEGKNKQAFKNLPMTGLVGLTGAPLIMFLREEQIRGIKHTKSEFDLLVQACLQAIKA